MTVPKLHTIYYYASGNCNLCCRHCWIQPALGASEPSSYTLFDILSPIFAEALELGLKTVKLTGGEPCLHPEIDRIIVELSTMGIHLEMETNGTLLNPDRVRIIAEQGVGVSVSLDGSCRETHEGLRGVPGCFDSLLAGMSLLQEAGVPYQVIFSLHSKNLSEMAGAMAIAEKLGARSFKINPVIDMGRGTAMKKNSELLSVPETLEFFNGEFFRLSKNTPMITFFDIPPAFKSLGELADAGPGSCGILGILGILHDGTAGLCGIGEKVPEMNFGSVLDGNLKKIWNDNPVLQKVRSHFPGNLNGVCGRCCLKMYCGGRCMAHTYVATGLIESGNPFCEEALRLGLFPPGRLVPQNFKV